MVGRAPIAVRGKPVETIKNEAQLSKEAIPASESNGRITKLTDTIQYKFSKRIVSNCENRKLALHSRMMKRSERYTLRLQADTNLDRGSC